MRKPDEFRQAAIKHRINEWPCLTCGICYEKYGYIFDLESNPEDPKVYFNSGCGCTRMGNIRNSSWQEVAEHYNLQVNEEVIKKMDEHFKFETDGTGND